LGVLFEKGKGGGRGKGGRGGALAHDMGWEPSILGTLEKSRIAALVRKKKRKEVLSEVCVNCTGFGKKKKEGKEGRGNARSR